MANYDSIDLDFTWDGDFKIGDDGDIADTRSDLIQSLRNELHTILRSEFDDWELHPQLGANISEFRGQPNSRKIGRAMEDRIRTKVIGATIVQPEDIVVQVLPVGRHQVLTTITVNAASTPNNNLDPNEPLAIAFLYDSLEDSVFFLDESNTAREFRGS